MADNIFTRLGRLFQSNVVIRKTDDNRLIVKDLDYTQTSFADKHHNSTSHAPWQEYYTQEIKDIVYARYEQDFIKFGYKK